MQAPNSPRNIIQKGSKSFALASIALPPKARKDVEALYAWCRYCDDFIDSQSLESSQGRVEHLRSLTFDQQEMPKDSVFFWPRLLIKKYAISPDYFEEVLRGMQMDLQHKGFRTLPDLEVYCFKVAGVVGLLMSPIIGVKNKEAEGHAVALGLAMQLTNICRDIKEDANMGRVYIPFSLLVNVNSLEIGVEVLLRQPELAHPAVVQLLKRADDHYKFGMRGLQFLPLRAAIAIGAAAYIYQSIGIRILKNASSDLSVAYQSRVVVGRGRKLWGLVMGLVWALSSRIPRIGASFKKTNSSKEEPAFFNSLQG